MDTTTKIALTLLGGALVAPGWLIAEENREEYDRYPHYRLVDVGTFGGPNSQYSTPATKVLNNHGLAVGVADTDIPDPGCFFDCVVDKPFVAKDGVTLELSVLPGGTSAFAYAVNERGTIVGSGQAGGIDPLTGSNLLHGMLWKNGKLIDLGTLGGNTNNPFAMNDRDEVTGATTNDVLDPFASTPMTACHTVPTQVCPDATFAFSTTFTVTTTEVRAYIWRDGVLHDLGTLGGPDSAGENINNRGDVTGWSYTSFTANPATGTPSVHPFFYSGETHRMTDMGTLGGTFAAPYWMNNRGQVVGGSNLAGDIISHPFIWSQDKGMQDLGDDGVYGHADFINDEGEVVGLFEDSSHARRAFYWRDGKITDLGTVGTDRDSEAISINSRGFVVGVAGVFGEADLHGFIWKHAGPLVALDDLTVPGTTVKVVSATDINERGEIAGVGQLPNGDLHAVLLIPCDEEHPHSSCRRY